MAQVVVGFPDELFGVEESVDQQATARDLPRHPAVETGIELSLRHLSTLHATQPGPVVDPQVRNSCKQDFYYATAEVVRNEEVGVDQMQLVDESLEHLLLRLEDLNVGVFLLLHFLLEVERQRLLIKLPEHGETLELFLAGRPILINLVLNDARNHGDFLSVVLGPSHLSREGESDESWARLVHVIDGADAVLWGGDGYLLLAPSSAVVRSFLNIFQSQPARSLNLLL